MPRCERALAAEFVIPCGVPTCARPPIVPTVRPCFMPAPASQCRSLSVVGRKSTRIMMTRRSSSRDHGRMQHSRSTDEVPFDDDIDLDRVRADTALNALALGAAPSSPRRALAHTRPLVPP
eukprot:5968032-Prymnesium_polylepis.1